MYRAIDVNESERVNRNYNISEIALINDYYYIKTMEEVNLKVKHRALRVMAITDRSRMCYIAAKQLQDKQYINSNLEIKNIDEYMIVGNGSQTIKKTNTPTKESNLDRLKSMSYEELFDYMHSVKYYFNWMKELLDEKFEAKYPTMSDKIEYFKDRNLNELVNIATMHDIKRESDAGRILCSLWRTQSIDKIERVAAINNRLMYTCTDESDRIFSNHFLETVKDDFTKEQYRIFKRTNEIFHILASVNVKYNKFTLDELNLVFDFYDNVVGKMGVDIPKILMLDDRKVVNLLNEYYELIDELENICEAL